MGLALNNLQRFICHKTQTTNRPKDDFSFFATGTPPPPKEYKNIFDKFFYHTKLFFKSDYNECNV